jgi:hypothetical protein
MRAKLVDNLTVVFNNMLYEIETLFIDKQHQNEDYIDLEINSIKMSISKQDFQKIIEDFFS